MIKNGLITALLLSSALSFLIADSDSELKKKIAEGRKVFTTLSLGNCIGCHSVQNDPMEQTGTLGPHLANMDLYPKEYLLEKIWDPNKTNPNTVMPPLGRNHKITKEQIEAVITYLQVTAKSQK